MAVAPKLQSAATQLLLRDTYETFFGIYDHESGPERPLALVAHHDVEDAVTGGPLFELIDVFADLEISKHFGISLNEFLAFPHDVCERLKEVARKRQGISLKAAEQIAAAAALAQRGAR